MQEKLENYLFDENNVTVVLEFYNLFWFLNKDQFRADKKPSNCMEKKSVFVDSGFVKICD